MLLHEAEVLCPGIEAKDMASTRHDQRHQHSGINQVIVDDEVVGVLNKRPIHVRKPVGDHQQYSERGADTHHQAGEQRQADQQMAILHEERRDRSHRRRRENGEGVVEGLGMIQETDDGPARDKDLMRSRVKKCPRHDEAKIKDQSLWHHV